MRASIGHGGGEGRPSGRWGTPPNAPANAVVAASRFTVPVRRGIGAGRLVGSARPAGRRRNDASSDRSMARPPSTVCPASAVRPASVVRLASMAGPAGEPIGQCDLGATRTPDRACAREWTRSTMRAPCRRRAWTGAARRARPMPRCLMPRCRRRRRPGATPPPRARGPAPASGAGSGRCASAPRPPRPPAGPWRRPRRRPRRPPGRCR